MKSSSRFLGAVCATLAGALSVVVASVLKSSKRLFGSLVPTSREEVVLLDGVEAYVSIVFLAEEAVLGSVDCGEKSSNKFLLVSMFPDDDIKSSNRFLVLPLIFSGNILPFVESCVEEKLSENLSNKLGLTNSVFVGSAAIELMLKLPFGDVISFSILELPSMNSQFLTIDNARNSQPILLKISVTLKTQLYSSVFSISKEPIKYLIFLFLK